MPTYKRSGLITILTCGAWSLIGPGKAQASIIDIGLTPPTLTAAAGATVTFGGVLTNTNSSTVFLNSVSLNLAGFPPGALDSTAFFTNAPLSLAAGAATGNIALFGVTIPNPFVSGAYIGTLTILGGASGASQTNLGSANFTVQVGSSGTSVPEPASATLWAVGAALIIAGKRRVAR